MASDRMAESGKISIVVDGTTPSVDSERVRVAGCEFWIRATDVSGVVETSLDFCHTSTRATALVSMKAWAEQGGQEHSESLMKLILYSDGSIFDRSTHFSCDRPTDGNPVTVHYEFTVTGFRSPRFYTFESEAECPGFSNVVFLVGVDKKRLYAAREVLAAYSTYFHKMFAGQFKESGNNEVALEHEDPDAFAEFLRYCYCCREPITMRNIGTLNRMADYYGAGDLAQICETWCIDNFDSFEKIELLKIVDQFKYPFLQHTLEEKITHGEISELFRNPDWRTLHEQLRAHFLQLKFN